MKSLIAATVLTLCNAAVADAAPDWCKDAAFKDKYDLADMSSKDYGRVLATFAKATCKPTPEAQANKAQIEAARQAWGKKFGMQEADWAEAVAYANVDERPGKIELSGKDFSAFTALDQYVAIRDGVVDGRGYPFRQADYLADMFEPNLTEAGRLAYIETCIGGSSFTMPVVDFAQCQGDIDAFDKTKLAQQISADKLHPGEQKLELRIRAFGLPARIKEHAQKLEKLFTKDAAYKKLWEAAAKGRATFASTIGKDTALLSLGSRMDSAHFFQSRKLFEGCEERTQAALDKILAEKVPAALFKGVEKDIPKPQNYSNKASTTVGNVVGPQLIDIPELAFITGPYAQCIKKGATRSFLTSALHYAPGYRGPRRAALATMMKEKIVLDDLNAKLEYPKVAQPFIDRIDGIGSAGGVVKSTRIEGDMVMVSLEKLVTKHTECVQSHRTNRVSRIHSDGTVSYELVCDKMGTVTWDQTPSDIPVEKKFAPLLKKGVVFSTAGTFAPHAVLAIWPSKTAALPTFVLGQAVK